MSPIGPWTPDFIARARALWDEGLSTLEIGRRLGVTKNALIGKAHRLEWPGRPSPIRRTGTASARPARAPLATLPALASDPIPTALPTAPAVLPRTAGGATGGASTPSSAAGAVPCVAPACDPVVVAIVAPAVVLHLPEAPRPGHIEIGAVFGRWTVMGEAARSASNKRRFTCRCVCGREYPVIAENLRSGQSKGCKYCAVRSLKSAQKAAKVAKIKRNAVNGRVALAAYSFFDEPLEHDPALERAQAIAKNSTPSVEPEQPSELPATVFRPRRVIERQCAWLDGNARPYRQCEAVAAGHGVYCERHQEMARAAVQPKRGLGVWP